MPLQPLQCLVSLDVNTKASYGHGTLLSSRETQNVVEPRICKSCTLGTRACSNHCWAELHLSAAKHRYLCSWAVSRKGAESSADSARQQASAESPLGECREDDPAVAKVKVHALTKTELTEILGERNSAVPLNDAETASRFHVLGSRIHDRSSAFGVGHSPDSVQQRLTNQVIARFLT